CTVLLVRRHRSELPDSKRFAKASAALLAEKHGTAARKADRQRGNDKQRQRQQYSGHRKHHVQPALAVCPVKAVIPTLRTGMQCHTGPRSQNSHLSRSWRDKSEGTQLAQSGVPRAETVRCESRDGGNRDADAAG